jgi:hypothetical protein
MTATTDASGLIPDDATPDGATITTMASSRFIRMGGRGEPRAHRQFSCDTSGLINYDVYSCLAGIDDFFNRRGISI